jgi:thermitase
MSRPPSRRLVVLLASVLALVSVSSPLPGASATADAAPGEILVKFRPGTASHVAAAVHRQQGGQVLETLPGIGVQFVRVLPGREAATVAGYARNPNVLFAEPNGLYNAVGVPDDPQVDAQWQYNNTGQTSGTLDADIDAFEAWNLTTGSPTVAIAVLDSGIDQSHEDLASKIVLNRNFTASRTVDDLYGHGTHVAGSAAAATNNGLGVAGTCPNCVLYNGKVLDDSGGGKWSAIAKGIVWATDNGAKVINMSFGGSKGSRSVAAAVDYAWNKGVVVVAAAGNAGAEAPFYPAYYANAIAVAATDNRDAKASFSNYGSWVDVAAPGVAILSTAPDHSSTMWGGGAKYGTASGTSMATPHLAGIAGLVWSADLCGGDPRCVRVRIESTADAIAGTGALWSYGRINACRAVAAPCS